MAEESITVRQPGAHADLTASVDDRHSAGGHRGGHQAASDFQYLAATDVVWTDGHVDTIPGLHRASAWASDLSSSLLRWNAGTLQQFDLTAARVYVFAVKGTAAIFWCKEKDFLGIAAANTVGRLEYHRQSDWYAPRPKTGCPPLQHVAMLAGADLEDVPGIPAGANDSVLHAYGTDLNNTLAYPEISDPAIVAGPLYDPFIGFSALTIGLSENRIASDVAGHVVIVADDGTAWYLADANTPAGAVQVTLPTLTLAHANQTHILGVGCDGSQWWLLVERVVVALDGASVPQPLLVGNRAVWRLKTNAPLDPTTGACWSIHDQPQATLGAGAGVLPSGLFSWTGCYGAFGATSVLSGLLLTSDIYVRFTDGETVCFPAPYLLDIRGTQASFTVGANRGGLVINGGEVTILTYTGTPNDVTGAGEEAFETGITVYSSYTDLGGFIYTAEVQTPWADVSGGTLLSPFPVAFTTGGVTYHGYYMFYNDVVAGHRRAIFIQSSLFAALALPPNFASADAAWCQTIADFWYRSLAQYPLLGSDQVAISLSTVLTDTVTGLDSESIFSSDSQTAAPETTPNISYNARYIRAPLLANTGVNSWATSGDLLNNLLVFGIGDNGEILRSTAGWDNGTPLTPAHSYTYDRATGTDYALDPVFADYLQPRLDYSTLPGQAIYCTICFGHGNAAPLTVPINATPSRVVVDHTGVDPLTSLVSFPGAPLPYRLAGGYAGDVYAVCTDGGLYHRPGGAGVAWVLKKAGFYPPGDTILGFRIFPDGTPYLVSGAFGTVHETRLAANGSLCVGPAWTFPTDDLFLPGGLGLYGLGTIDNYSAFTHAVFTQGWTAIPPPGGG